MKELTESEIAKAYVGKPYSSDHLRRIASGTQTGAVVFSRRITRSQGALIGITDELFERWWDAGIYVSVFIELDEDSQTIKKCRFVKDKESDGKFSSLTPTNEDLGIFHNVMEYITT